MTSGNFTYANPRTIHWGAGCLGSQLDRELGRRRAFVVTTRSVEANPALLGRLATLLGERCVGQFAGISQHAPAAAVATAAEAARAAEPEVLISFGGGSPIDAAKSVAFALATGLDLRHPRAAEKARALHPANLVPHLAIPTTLSAAELSGLAGFTTEDSHEKVGLRGEGLIPQSVFFDAELTLHTPLELWLSTGIRAVDHAVETLLADGAHPLSDVVALEALRRLKTGLIRTKASPDDLDARTESQLGAWFSFTLPGPAASGLSHTLGKRIGSRHNIPHGVTSSLLLPHVMRYLEPRTRDAQSQIAGALDAVDATAADAVASLISELDLPQHLGAYGLSDTDLEAAAGPVASDAYPVEDLVGIYKAAM